MALTALEAALFATPLIGAPLGAAITVWAQRFTTKSTLRTQREVAEQTIRSQQTIARENLDAQRVMAADNRLWTKRADLYPSIIDTVLGETVKAVNAANELSVELPAVVYETLSALRKHTSALNSWAAPEAYEYWGEFYDLVGSIIEVTGNTPSKHMNEYYRSDPDSIRRIRDWAIEVDAAMYKMVDRLRRELHTQSLESADLGSRQPALELSRELGAESYDPDDE